MMLDVIEEQDVDEVGKEVVEVDKAMLEKLGLVCCFSLWYRLFYGLLYCLGCFGFVLFWFVVMIFIIGFIIIL